jgi:iron complex transport system substrate-binding protein
MQKGVWYGKHCLVGNGPILGILVLAIILSGCTSVNPGSVRNADNSSIITVTDAYGDNVTFSHTFQRIVCQNGQVAELLIDIGAGDRIVGLTGDMKDPFILNQTPNAISIGDTMTPDIETMIALKPDVLIFYGYKKPTNLDKILGTNTTLLYNKGYELQELPKEARMLGRITGCEDGAERYALFTEHYINLVKNRLSNLSEAQYPRVYIESWTDYTAHASDSSMHTMITFLHAKNIAENLTSSGTVSPEWVIDQNPEVIFKLAITGENTTAVRNKVMTRIGSSKIQAVQNNRVFVLDTYTATSPRAVVGMLYLAKALYPERFTDIDPEEVLHEYAREFLPGLDIPGSFCP